MRKEDRAAEHASPDGHRSQSGEKGQADADTELTSLRRKLAAASQLLASATTALVALDKTGCIVHVNRRAVDLTGAEESYLLKKPFSLFVAPEDQATFYIHRSRIVGGAGNGPFEIQLRRKDGSRRSVRIEARAIDSPVHQLPGMLLAVDDISDYRRVLERLQFNEDTTRLLYATLEDLATWSAADIDEIIMVALEKIGIVTGADRVYVGLFHEKKTRLSITHEWLGDGITSPALKNMPVGSFSHVLKKIKGPATASVDDIDAMAPTDRSGHAGFHAAGSRSFMFAPLLYGRHLSGIIGCDAVRQAVNWPEETRQLVACIGTGIVQALVRTQTEAAPDPLGRSILPRVDPEVPPAGDQLPEYKGPIEFIEPSPNHGGASGDDWQFEAQPPGDADGSDTVFLKDGKTTSIACNHCNRQRRLDISDIRVMGTRLKATCVCGRSKFIKVELRREHRKAVRLKGVFMRGPGDRLALKSDDWGHIDINNLSRRGIGFTLLGNADIRVGDQFRVKFTLDNTARSIIQKEVVVRSVVRKTVGCQFEGPATCDVTLGFYLMN